MFPFPVSWCHKLLSFTTQIELFWSSRLKFSKTPTALWLELVEKLSNESIFKMKTRVHRNQTILWDHHHFLISNCIKMFYFNEAKSLWFSSSFSMQGYVAVCSRKWHYPGKQSLCNNFDIAKMIFFFFNHLGWWEIFFFSGLWRKGCGLEFPRTKSWRLLQLRSGCLFVSRFLLALAPFTQHFPSRMPEELSCQCNS